MQGIYSMGWSVWGGVNSRDYGVFDGAVVSTGGEFGIDLLGVEASSRDTRLAGTFVALSANAVCRVAPATTAARVEALARFGFGVVTYNNFWLSQQGNAPDSTNKVYPILRYGFEVDMFVSENAALVMGANFRYTFTDAGPNMNAFMPFVGLLGRL
jgi:hypothetical protein